MGHHLFPVPFNFPVPGHQVRHSALAALKCLPASHPVGLAMKPHDAPEKSSRSLSGEWVASQQPIGGQPVDSCSVPVGSRVQFEGKGGWGTHRGGDRLMFWWCFFFFFFGTCMWFTHQEITPAEVGEEHVSCVIPAWQEATWATRGTHGGRFNNPHPTPSANGPSWWNLRPQMEPVWILGCEWDQQKAKTDLRKICHT